MRRTIIAVFMVLGAVLAVGTAGAKSHGDGGGGQLVFAVSGTFTGPAGAETVPFTGTVTVERFLEAEGTLAVAGTVAADQPGLFQPLAVSVAALAAPAVDPVSGDCTVTVGTVSTLIEREFWLFVEGTTLDLGSGPRLCGVVRAVDKDPVDQGAVARALNKALDLS